MQRVTNGILVSDLIRTLNERMRTLGDLQSQATAGKRVIYASDDPAAAGLILELRNRLRQNEQFQENAAGAVGWLTDTEAVLQQLSDVLTQARTDALEGANGTLTPDELIKLAENVNGYLETILSLANSQHNGKSLFGGTNTNQAAFATIRDPESGWIATVSPNAAGISGGIFRQVENQNIQINISGNEVFMPEGAGGSQDMFQILIDLRDALATGNAGVVEESIERIDLAKANVSDCSALTGTQMNRLTSMQDMLLLKATSITDQLSQEEDADLVEVMTQLTLEQNAYQAALNVGAMVIQPSLVNFI
ncbi:MAG: flagellar hook-associated protein 3 [Candidatus Zixiibacteriota bacterium]|nr:MAG: flagellar hook-associated protein 3 [candidate division Zixibacteria bacterium]